MAAIKQIARDPALAFYYAQKAVRSVPLRSAIGSTLAAWVGKRGPSAPPSATAMRVASELKGSGFGSLPEKTLTPSAVARAREELSGCVLQDNHRPGSTFSLQAVPSHVIKARHDPQDVLRCRPLMDLANDPDILSAVTEYLGATPTITLAEAWWTFGEHNTNAQGTHDDIFHRDVEDFRFLKLFCYLTDAEIDTGAHRFVLGSHADKLFTRRGPISEGDVKGAYAPETLKTVMGPAGTCFLEDTWGIHRALPATRGRRFIFQVQYSLSIKPAFGPGQPRLPLPAGYDPFINRRLYVC